MSITLRPLILDKKGRDKLKKRILSRVVKRISEGNRKLGLCWEWAGQNISGYGVMKVGKTRFSVRSLAYTLWGRKPRQGDRALWSSCRNPSCVNPNHLTPNRKKGGKKPRAK